MKLSHGSLIFQGNLKKLVRVMHLPTFMQISAFRICRMHSHLIAIVKARAEMDADSTAHLALSAC
jgi:hypoxanthine-guanine phosphoribosyltransferase